MPNPVQAIYNIRLMDDLARGSSALHRLHPLTKLTVTTVYLVMVISFGKYQIGPLVPFVFYPLLLTALSDLPAGPVLKRILMVEPFIFMLAVFSPILDRQAVQIGPYAIAAGWLAFLSILLKSTLTVSAVILLISTTGMDKLAAALRMLHVPRVFVLQLLLTYRYISLLAEETGRLVRAHSLRTPGRKGIVQTAWGSLAGGLLLRSLDRAQRVYQAMCLRGFEGEYRVGGIQPLRIKDMIYILAWLLFFLAARVVDLPALLGMLLTGVLG